MKNARPYLMVLAFLGYVCLAFSQNRQKVKLSDTTSKDWGFAENHRAARGDLNLFADSTQLSTSDYQQQIENTYVGLHNIDNASELGLSIDNVRTKLRDDDSVLLVLHDNILYNSRALNLRNLQVFKTLLENIQNDLEQQGKLLDSTENQLAGLRTNMRKLMSDTVLRQLMRDSALRQQFADQLKEMRQTWRTSTGKLRRSIGAINRLQTHASSNMIATVQLLERVNTLVTTSATRIFGKEYPYLWEKDKRLDVSDNGRSFHKAYDGEKKALNYYFRDSGNKRLFLLLIGVLFLVWIYGNIHTLKAHGALGKLDGLDFTYLPSGYIVSAFVVLFAIAPLFDLYAPSAYIESMQFMLMIILTIIFWKKWPGELFRYWVALLILYGCFSFTHHMADPGGWQRVFMILLNLAALTFGFLFLSRMRQYLYLHRFLRMVIILHNVFNVLAILCNIAGRFSLGQILGNAAIFSFMQAIGLAVFSKICVEAMLLQLVAGRIKRGIKEEARYEEVLHSFRPLIFFVVVVLWLIVFTTNLNVYPFLLKNLLEFLEMRRSIGNASFTVGGILLFFFIIWVAHLLQQYVGYFFGDLDTEEEVQDKGKRSRLLIAKLVLLCLGYLLAVAASGIPMDKITIVLGALGVGIGLGLQNIVNNFVSGIVLIFDRPLQIGDVVEIGEKTGRVREIGLRSSTLLTEEGAEVIIPNGDILSQQIVNWTLTTEQRRMEMEFSVMGSMDMEVICTAVKKGISASKYVYPKREPQVLFTQVNDDGFDVKVFFWITAMFKMEEAKSDILILVYEELKVVGIQIE